MSGVWGKNIKLSIFGESHGKAIGITIDGLVPGIKLDIDYIKGEMERRMPGKNKLSTARKETDQFEILSGYFNDRTTGTPLCATIRNSDQHSKDYSKLKNLMRPGHADYTGNIRYRGFNDYRGGGHFSGRITAPLVFAGAVAKQVLAEKGIVIGSHIKSISDVEDNSFDKVNVEESLLKSLLKEEFPTINKEKGIEMRKLIIDAKGELDSVGGIVETAILNLPVGIGSPFFYSVESHLSHMIFSIPAVKGIEFGEGFDISKLRGSKANDEYYMENDNVKTNTNNNGGILGGITNGMPLIFRTAFKPTASIARLQHTIDIERHENAELEITGRHDPCIVQRAVPVVEAAAAISILDLMYDIK
ncbi:chorismate synthase [Clostridium pasteurianum DSM 525 = ATCC 6013]|uniref:Chorismate synthase n=1 Tax=Clostridium pasteurianum DSM 525 = ATCC 6013 TaxID=1262449 RepID=A0A0H3J9A1_CLOPA|nr:chorismate synthase [Clostridium pasteurianum]AJA49867.1 chorismate synthase [Clostridium pasteurianum DSM 525 = ATCC 6013]AJA53855.1 chorismate synthase [Clostridium pasteurianum DSM 525 = ATCC 6013]AOZ77010.1 chorismate synthase [Clostridium pasteurianum DSM 525 = ATCC 6013]AOZ80807.1 chorismate synthase [Clostridium pasteurianum]ELP57827.1 chorismate synthase [Clostridium pasteurianum DSM 525 = ATCC 6013]